MSVQAYQARYLQTEKGKAARRKAQDNWNAKRNKARAAERQKSQALRVKVGRVSSVFEIAGCSV